VHARCPNFLAIWHSHHSATNRFLEAKASNRFLEAKATNRLLEAKACAEWAGNRGECTAESGHDVAGAGARQAAATKEYH
jgi:hypothetical protein